jgi:putative PIN family toxin of toxin-antitoxin system
MSFADRIVFDTSTLVGAMLRPQSVPGLAFLAAMEQGDLCASPVTLEELGQVVVRPKFDAYIDQGLRKRFFERYRYRAAVFAVSATDESNLLQPCRDPKDNKFLALAQHCRASLIVSSDKDLLVLHPWQGIPILTPAQFLARSPA